MSEVRRRKSEVICREQEEIIPEGIFSLFNQVASLLVTILPLAESEKRNH